MNVADAIVSVRYRVAAPVIVYILAILAGFLTYVFIISRNKYIIKESINSMCFLFLYYTSLSDKKNNSKIYKTGGR